jgi:hypothetical protein
MLGGMLCRFLLKRFHKNFKPSSQIRHKRSDDEWNIFVLFRGYDAIDTCNR